MAEEKTRLQVVINASVCKDIDAIAEARDLTSRTDVIRCAIKLLKAVAELESQGYKLCLQGPDGAIGPIIIVT